jgi:hypothetical protein
MAGSILFPFANHEQTAATAAPADILEKIEKILAPVADEVGTTDLCDCRQLMPLLGGSICLMADGDQFAQAACLVASKLFRQVHSPGVSAACHRCAEAEGD